MPIIFKNGTYYNISADEARKLANFAPNVSAQFANIRGNSIAICGVAAGLNAVPKSGTVYVYNGSWFSDAFTTTNVRAGQSIGVTTGREENKGWGIYGYLCVEVELQVKIGGNNPGTRVWIEKEGLTLSVPSGGGQTGGDTNFPIRFGSKNNAVADFQRFLISCGKNVGAFGADGDWGNATQTAAASVGVSVINSRAELNAIIAKGCGQTGGGQTGGGSGGGTTGGTTVDIPATTSAPTDNTWMWVAGAVGTALVVKSMSKKKKKKKKGK